MADEKKEVAPTAVDLFRKKLQSEKAKLEENLLEGIKHTDARVRSLAAKVAIRTQEHKFVKQHILPILNSEKSKKVLRAVSDKIYRKELAEKVKALVKQKVAAAKTEKTEAPAAAAPAAPAAKEGDKA